MQNNDSKVPPYWALPLAELLQQLESSTKGLSAAESSKRFNLSRSLQLDAIQYKSGWTLFGRQFTNPLVIILIAAASISGVLADWTDAIIILAIIFVSACISFWREYSSEIALKELAERVKLSSSVMRDGIEQSVPNEELVPGDVVLLSPGKLVPADCIVLSAQNLFINQSVITGESFAVQKLPKPDGMSAKTPVAQREHCLFLGSSVLSGIGQAIVVAIAKNTEYGRLAQSLSLAAPETEFDKGLHNFGGLLLRIMLIMVFAVFAAHAYKGNATAESLMFAVALAVGLSPELLPAILSINLATGAKKMASIGVLVRRLNSIENLGSMDILCTDKTGTITEGAIQLQGAYDVEGHNSSLVLHSAALNAKLQTGLSNPLDDTILKAYHLDCSHAEKVAEIPYDFVRKRLSVIVREPAGLRLIAKGAFGPIINLCTSIKPYGELNSATEEKLKSMFNCWSEQGIRVLAVAEKMIDFKENYTKDDEKELAFMGFLAFADQPKKDVKRVKQELDMMGVNLKIITGDNAVVSRHVALSIGMHEPHIITGEELNLLHHNALVKHVAGIDVFAEVDPNQKERIILALRRGGHVVGYMGDGINDISAMHAADVSISVHAAVDVAKAVADFVLLEKDLTMLKQGILEGRKTFANTLKYILMTTSANLGNMFSMAIASLTLPFLPLLASQILLNNFLSDIPALGLAADSVDSELIAKPRRWNTAYIRRYMLTFGLLSSLFDMLTFGLLLFIFKVGIEGFRTAWFIESLLTELVIALVLRTQRRFYQSRPGSFLLLSSIAVSMIAAFIPFLPFASDLGFVPIPWSILLAIIFITIVYVIVTEFAKAIFSKHSIYP